MSQMTYRPCMILCATILAVANSRVRAQETPDPPQAEDEVELTLDDVAGSTDATTGDDEPPSFLDELGENLRVDVDIVFRVQTTSRRGEPEFLGAIGLDIHKVFSDEQGDFGTAVLQPYIVRRDNSYMAPTRMIETDQDDSFAIELHKFFFNYTRWGRGRTNIKVGHFDVPFGLGIGPVVDTHFTLRQFQPMHNAGFKLDWGVSLNGALPSFDYEISITTGTGKDLTGLGKGTYLFAGRVGTPSDKNTALGVSGLVGEVIDDHGAHRVDEGDPLGDIRQMENIIQRWRVGVDGTHLMGAWTLRGELSGGEDFDQSVVNLLGEIEWTTSNEMFMAYLQGRYNTQDGHFGWSDDVQTRLGFRWRLNNVLTLSAQWIHEFEHYAEQSGGLHLPEDTYSLQLRVRF